MTDDCGLGWAGLGAAQAEIARLLSEGHVVPCREAGAADCSRLELARPASINTATALKFLLVYSP